MFKNNPIKRISENFNVQFRAEFFNILNRANFAVPVTPDNTDIFDSTGSSDRGCGLADFDDDYVEGDSVRAEARLVA